MAYRVPAVFLGEGESWCYFSKHIFPFSERSVEEDSFHNNLNHLPVYLRSDCKCHPVALEPAHKSVSPGAVLAVNLVLSLSDNSGLEGVVRFLF